MSKINSQYFGYKDLTLAIVEKALTGLFKNVHITYDMVRAKILPGYFYKIQTDSPGYPGTRTMVVGTGIGGANMFIDQFEKTSMAASWCAEAISVYSGGEYTTILELIEIDLKSNNEVI